MFYFNTEDIIKAQNGDKEVFEKILKENNGLIWSLVKRFIGKGYEIEDLYQIGCIGFIKAVKRFDINFNYQLSTFAVPYILGEIKKFIRDDGIIKISRNIKELSLKIRDIENDYFRREMELPTTKQIAEMLNVKEEEVLIAIDARRQVESINEELYDDSKCQRLEQIIPKIDEQNKIIDNLTIKEMVNNLDTRDKQIINLRFFKEKTQAQVAKILGISQVQVSRLERRILNDMKMELVYL
ncbi:MAG: sigma-70 family RNA polymerase sigma factor [Clostridia bacterium]|nr:sigma-70 family RNA polymerase sigma factor [Clostridia bacterium]